MVRPSRAVTRSRSCSAALRPKVSASTESGEAPRRSIRSTIASTNVVVLPVPGPASTSNGPPGWSTTDCWNGSSDGGARGADRSWRSRYVVTGPSDHRRPTVSATPGGESSLQPPVEPSHAPSDSALSTREGSTWRVIETVTVGAGRSPAPGSVSGPEVPEVRLLHVHPPGALQRRALLAVVHTGLLVVAGRQRPVRAHHP